MARPSRPWFRFYVEALHDPKLRRMTPACRWVWVAVLGAARQSCEPGRLLVSEQQPMDEHDLADLASVAVRDVRKALDAMQAAGMVHRDELSGAWCVTKWDARQFETDNVTERTRKHRSRERDGNVPNPFPGTPPDTETDTDNPLASSSDSRGPVENPPAGSLIDQALDLAARRYGEHRMTNGDGKSLDGLARWWTQENADGARLRAVSLLEGHDLTATQLADALLQPNPSWLRSFRRQETPS